jgi:3-methyl-2-oxobutanoate hydroxymethyltransferase
MAAAPDKVTTATIRARKGTAERTAVVTAYDVVFARLADEAGIDVVLVGDSLGMVVQGERNTLAVTLDDIVYHTRIVSRGVRRAHLVADMPFMSYQASVEDGMRAAGRLLKEGGAEAVKLEGGVEVAELVRRLVAAGIPVMGHVGLTPQSVHAFGGFKLQGRTAEQRARIIDDARSRTRARTRSSSRRCRRRSPPRSRAPSRP